MKRTTFAPAFENCHFLTVRLLRCIAKSNTGELLRNRAIIYVAISCILIGLQPSPINAQQKKANKTGVAAKIAITSPVLPAGVPANTPIVVTGNAVYLEYTVQILK